MADNLSKRVLVVDDASLVRLYYRKALEKAGFHVEEALNGLEGIERLLIAPFDLLIVDINMPQMDGLEVCRRIRAAGDLPILFLSSRDEEIDRVLGIELGADDYVVKPFQFEELEARLNALLRRSSGFTQASIEAGALRLDLNRKQATVNDEPLALTAFEYRILEYLMRHQQQVVAKERLMEQLYPDDEERDANVIEVLVGRLRRKLEAQGNLKPIETVRGLGYLFTERCR